MDTKEILSYTNGGWDIYEHYYRQSPFYKGTPFVLNKKMLSPFRQESNPSFAVHPHRTRGTSELWYNDFGDPERNATGNAFTFVAYMFGFDLKTEFKSVLAKIQLEILGVAPDQEYVPGAFSPKTPDRPIKEKLPLILETVPYKRPWNNRDLLYFAQFLVCEPGYTVGRAKEHAEHWLNLYHAFPVTKYCSVLGTNRRYFPEYSEDPIYVFYFPRTNRAKIYRPFTIMAQNKWRSNVRGEEDVFGFDLLPKQCDKLFIKAGNKDTMAWASWIGEPCFPLNSETANIDFIKPVITSMSDSIYTVMNNDFEHINRKTGLVDNTGLKVETKLLNEHGYQPANFFLKEHGINDVAEFVRVMMRDKRYDVLEETKLKILKLK